MLRQYYFIVMLKFRYFENGSYIFHMMFWCALQAIQRKLTVNATFKINVHRVFSIVQFCRISVI